MPAHQSHGLGRAALILALAGLFAPCADAFDKVLLKDGRLIVGKLLESPDAGFVRLQLAGVEVPIRSDLVDKTFVEDLEDYVPKNKQEEDYLAKGWVIFEGRWMSRTRRETELKKRRDAEDAEIEQARREQKWSNAKVLESPHFIVKSNCPQAVMDDYASRLENYYKNFLEAWDIKIPPSRAREKQKFFLYRNLEDFQKITQMGGGVRGFFSPTLGELHLYHDTIETDYTISVLYHEGNHLLTHLIEPSFRYPTWMNEGMAEYYGSAVLDEKGEFVVGGLQYGRIASMRTDEANGRVIPLEEILLAEQSAYKSRQYAYGWSFVHFLMQHPRYSGIFRKFFATLPQNKDIGTEVHSGGVIQGGKEYNIVVGIPDLALVLEDLQKRLGKSLAELESEWKEYTAQAYGELSANAYYRAAQLARFSGDLTEDALEAAFTYYQKAVAMQIQVPSCYREYAEFLRHGGDEELSVMDPDLPLAWTMIQKAIEMDPVEPLNYTEAAGILLPDSPVQDLDRAQAMVETARALGPSRLDIRLLADELVALIEPAREKRHAAAEEAERMAELDQRVWVVQPFFVTGQEEPAKLEALSTDDLRELIAAGVVDGEDWVFQTFRFADPDTGELAEPKEPWDKAWTALKDVPEFAPDLEAARAATGK